MKIIIALFVAIALLAPLQTHAQEEGLVAEWHFDEGSGTIITDSSGLDKHGTFITNPFWTAGKFGSGVLTSDKSYISVPAVDLSSEWSITAWFLSPIPTNEWETLTRGSNDHQILASYGKDLGTFDNAGRTGFHDCGWDINTLQEGWHHIIAVGKIDGQTYFYVDGDYRCSSNYRSTSDVISIGNYQGGGQPWGTIDEVKIYSHVLSDDEIKSQYEGTHLTITKTASPQSIKQGQTTTITLTVKNTGSTEISDIEIADTIPSYLTFIDGETSKMYDFLAPNDARQISYTLQFNDAGTFNLEPAIATYANDKGNYKTIESKPASVEVIRSIVENSAQKPKSTNGNVNSASVNLHGEKTDVELGEDVLLKLSAVNIIGNPIMHVQVIIIPPSGWSVTSSEFAKSGAGQYSTTYELESGGGKDIEVRIVPNQIGDEFQVEGRIIYYFGDDVSTREDHTLSLPIKVGAKSDDAPITINQPDVEPKDNSKESPRFALITAMLKTIVLAVLAVAVVGAGAVVYLVKVVGMGVEEIIAKIQEIIESVR